MYQQPPVPPQGLPPSYQQQQYEADLRRNYTAAAWLSALLSVLFFIPGLIATIINLVEANNIKKRTGVTPQGYGCLLAVLLWCTIPPALILLFVIVSAIGGAWH